MASQILKFLDSSKIQKSKYRENKKLFFLQKKKLLYVKSHSMVKNSFLAEVTFLWRYAVPQNASISKSSKSNYNKKAVFTQRGSSH